MSGHRLGRRGSPGHGILPHINDLLDMGSKASPSNQETPSTIGFSMGLLVEKKMQEMEKSLERYRDEVETAFKGYRDDVERMVDERLARAPGMPDSQSVAPEEDTPEDNSDPMCKFSHPCRTPAPFAEL